MSNLTLRPTEISARGAFYETLDPSGALLWWVATHTYEFEDGWQPKTPAGTYTCQRGIHTIPTGEKFDTFEVLNVPGHTGILFVHPGNRPQHDSDGCFICGQSPGFLGADRAVIASRPAFAKFTENRRSIDIFTLTIEPLAL